MAIKIPSGFQVTVQEPIDNRLVLSKAEMKATVPAAMPTKYLCVCKDDGQLYIYDSTATVSEETGKFRVYSSGATYTAGDNVQISDQNVISATDTKYTAGNNVQISDENVVSATDTKYTAGTNITIDENNVISATGGGSSYTAGDGIKINDNQISVDDQVVAKVADIPTKTSDLTNDSGFITNEYHDAAKQDKLATNDNVVYPLYVDSGELRLGYGNGLRKAEDTNQLEVKVKENGGISLDATGISVDTSVVQPKLTAGTNITIDANNVISSTGGGASYTAGDGIKIESNTLSAKLDSRVMHYDSEGNISANQMVGATETTGAVEGVTPSSEAGASNKYLNVDGSWSSLLLGEEITVSQAVGGISAGTVYSASTTLLKLFQDLLGGSGPAPSTITVYYGASKTAPTGIAGLTSKTLSSSSVVGDHDQNIVCDDEEDGEFPIYAVPSGYKISKWVAASAPSFPLSTVKVVADNYNIYYVDSLVYDAPDGTDYVITIAQEG